MSLNGGGYLKLYVWIFTAMLLYSNFYSKWCSNFSTVFSVQNGAVTFLLYIFGAKWCSNFSTVFSVQNSAVNFLLYFQCIMVPIVAFSF